MSENYLLVLVVSFLVQSTLLIALGLICTKCLTWNAPARHAVLFITLVSVAMLPVLEYAASACGFSILPASGFSSTLDANELPTVANRVTEPALTTRQDFAVYRVHPEPLAGLRPANATKDLPLPAAHLLAGLWLLGIVLLSFRWQRSIRRAVRLRQLATPDASHEVGAVFSEVSKYLNLRRTPRLLISTDVDSPAVTGFWNVAVLLPARLTTKLSASELRDIFLHELAHVQRNDPLLASMQRCVAILFWPQPLIHYLNRAISDAREDVCDNYVLSSGDAVHYGRTLLAVGESMPPALSLGLLAGRLKLEDRISRLLNERRNQMTKSTFTSKAIGCVFSITCAVLLALTTPTLAQDDTPPSGLQKTKGTVVTEKGMFTLSPDEGNVFVLRSKEDESELSPAEQEEAKYLKDQYESLKQKKDDLVNQMKEIEDKLGEFGFGTQKEVFTWFEKENGKPTFHFRAAGDSDMSSWTHDLRTAAEPKPNSAPSANRVPIPNTFKYKLVPPSAPASPESPSRGSSNLEDRMQRLEELMERFIESAEASPNKALRASN